MEISFWRIGAEPKFLALPVAIFFSRSKLLTTVTLCHFLRWAFFFVISVGLEELVDKTRGTVYLTLNSLFWCMSSTGNLGRNIKKKKKKKWESWPESEGPGWVRREPCITCICSPADSSVTPHPCQCIISEKYMKLFDNEPGVTSLRSIIMFILWNEKFSMFAYVEINIWYRSHTLSHFANLEKNKPAHKNILWES